MYIKSLEIASFFGSFLAGNSKASDRLVTKAKNNSVSECDHSILIQVILTTELMANYTDSTNKKHDKPIRRTV